MTSNLDVAAKYRRKRILTKTVRPAWYRRYANVLPKDERVTVQPLKEIIAEEEMFLAMKTPPPEVDRAEELARKLAIERGTKVRTILDILEGKSPAAKAQLASVQQTTNAIKYMTEAPPEDIHKYKRDRLRRIEGMKSFKLPETSRWWNVRNNPLIKRKLRILAAEKKSEEIRHRWQKAYRTIMAIIRFGAVMAEIARTTTEVFKDFNAAMEREMAKNKEAGALFFDKAYYKSTTKTTTLDQDAIMLLRNVEHLRGIEDIKKTAVSLRFLRSFASFPAHFQLIMTKIGWYLEVPQDKVIIREGQHAHNFYFLLSGKAVSVKLVGSPVESEAGGFEVLKVYERDAMFGEEGIFDRDGFRPYTVTCIEECSLLSVNIDDFHRATLMSEENDNPEFIKFLSQLDFMRYFPMKRLIDDAGDGNIIYYYFTPGMVMTRKTRECDYIIVIKAGSCKVMAEISTLLSASKTRSLSVILPAINEPPESLSNMSSIASQPSNGSSRCSQVEFSNAEVDKSANKWDESCDVIFQKPPEEKRSRVPCQVNRLSVSSTRSRRSMAPRKSLASDGNYCRLSDNKDIEDHLNISRFSEEHRKYVDCQLVKPPKTEFKSHMKDEDEDEDDDRHYEEHEGVRFELSRKRSDDTDVMRRARNLSKRWDNKDNIVGSTKRYLQEAETCHGTHSYKTRFSLSSQDSIHVTKRSSSRSSGWSNAMSSSKRLEKAGTVEKVVVIPGRKGASAMSIKETMWVFMRQLRESDIIGIHDLDLGDDSVDPCDVAVVSEGCEAIMIHKKYFLQNASPKMMAHLRSSSFIMPNESALFLELKKQTVWKSFRAKCLREMKVRQQTGNPE